MVSVQDLSLPAAQDRPVPAVQRAYFYIVLLVAIHMIVLGVANLLRVGAEIALGAPSGGFTGLPFVFAEFNRPREQYREQASLAIALLLVAVPAWYLHYRAADAAARRSLVERGSALRSAYLQIVILVTALLVFGYGQRVLRLVLMAWVVGPASTQFFGLEPDWVARAAGAFAMVVAAASTLVFHVRIASADRASVALSARAADLGHLVRYALALIGLAFFTFSFASLLTTLWQQLLFPFPQIEPFYPPGVPRPPRPSLDETVRFDLANSIPSIACGIALWAAAWLRAERAVRARGEAPTVRRIAVYLVIALSALAVLFSLTSAIALVLARALGDRSTDQSLGRDLGSSVPFAIVFAVVWWYHRRVVEGDAARETEAGRAGIRRAYYYLIAAIGLAMAAIGAAGAIGAVGSGWLGLMNHDARETATWIALVLVGGPAWAFHWRASQQRLDDDERRSLQRRVYLYLAILGSVGAVLVFGSALLFNLLKGLLAFRFDLALWHDLWHFSVDTAVGAVALAWHFRLVRADRAALAAAGLEETYHVTLLVKAADRAAAQARVTAALEGQSDITVRS